MFPNTEIITLKVADGKHVQPMGKCVLRLGVNGRTQPFEFTVLKQCSHDVILGWDFLQSTQAVIDCGRLELSLEDSIDAKLQNSCRLSSIKDYIIPARSMSQISVSVTEMNKTVDAIIEANKNLLLSKEVFIPCTMITIQDCTGKIWIANGRAEPQTIPKGMCVGFAEPLDENSLNVISDTTSGDAKKAEDSDISVNYPSMVSTDLTLKQQEKLVQVLKQFSKIFDNEKKGVTNTIKVRHRINTGDHPPIKQRAYRVSPAERRIIQNEVDKMQKKGIIQPSESPWSSPVVLVRKKDGSWRFCVDYRRLNQVTKKDVYPLPRIDDTLDCLKGAKYFSSIDLYSGYWQVQVDEADREKTAFITSEGLYEFKVMPFGLCNAPATFERMMDNLLRHLKWTMCLCYLDDIIVFSETFDDHLSRLTTVLQCIQNAGLILNPKKCLFGAEEIKILGHRVSGKGVRPDVDKIRAVKEFPTPKNVHDVKSFLGLCSYYRRFIRDFCHRARPLQVLLKGDSKFHWGRDQEEAFDDLKEALISDPVLGLYDENSPTEIHTDASGYGIGAVLTQVQNGEEKVIAYASRSLTKAEKNYSTTERECLAAVWAINKFRPYLFGKSFTIVTDHHSLCWLAGLKDPSGRLARWALRLQEYDISIVYKSGLKHKDADSLSRNPVENEIPPSGITSVTTQFDLAAEQLKDPKIAQMIQSERKCEEESNNSHKSYQLINGILYKKNFDPCGKKWLPVIPKHHRLDILKHFHDEPTAGHLGFLKTYDRIRKRFHWPGLYRSVRQYVTHCRECQRRKAVPQQPPGRLVPIPPAESAFQRIGIDLLGRFPKSSQGNKWIIVCTDYLTRYAVTRALPNASAPEVATFLLEYIILTHGAPRVLISDRGQVFQSKMIHELNRLCNISHRMTTAYHPQTNGLTERFNKTLTDMLSIYVDLEQKKWDEVLPFVTFAYNTAKQDTTGFSPFFLLHGREAETTLDTIFPCVEGNEEDDYVSNLITKAEESRQLARLRTLNAQAKDSRRYDSRHRMVSYKPGDLVWVFIPIRKVGLSEKLLKRYFGPYKILRKLSDVTYEVEDYDPTSRRRKSKDVVHVLRMKPYHNPDAQDACLDDDNDSNNAEAEIVEQAQSHDAPSRSYSGPLTRSRATKDSKLIT
jgi:transposase InsO family protein